MSGRPRQWFQFAASPGLAQRHAEPSRGAVRPRQSGRAAPRTRPPGCSSRVTLWRSKRPQPVRRLEDQHFDPQPSFMTSSFPADLAAICRLTSLAVSQSVLQPVDAPADFGTSSVAAKRNVRKKRVPKRVYEIQFGGFNQQDPVTLRVRLSSQFALSRRRGLRADNAAQKMNADDPILLAQLRQK